MNSEAVQTHSGDFDRCYDGSMVSKNNNLLPLLIEFVLCIWMLFFAAGAAYIGPVPVKSTVLIFFIFISTFALLIKNYIVVRYAWSLIVLSFGVFLSCLIGVFNGFDSSVLSQAGSMVSSFLVVVVAFVLYDNGLLRSERLERVVYITAMLGFLIKVVIAISAMLGVFSAGFINDTMQNFFGSASYDVNVFGGFMGVLPRIQNTGDVSFLVIFLFYVRKHSGLKVALAWLLALVFVLVSYSRYFMMFFALISAYMVWRAIRKKPGSTILGLGALMLILVSANIISIENIFLNLTERFVGQVQSESDGIRIEQSQYILRIFVDHPFWGIGMGGYIYNYVRDPGLLWHYELEYLAMLMQFGFLGFLLIVVTYVFYVVRMFFSNYEKNLHLVVVVGVMAWLVTPMQSSLFIGTSSAFLILSIFFLSRGARH